MGILKLFFSYIFLRELIVVLFSFHNFVMDLIELFKLLLVHINLDKIAISCSCQVLLQLVEGEHLCLELSLCWLSSVHHPVLLINLNLELRSNLLRETYLILLWVPLEIGKLFWVFHHLNIFDSHLELLDLGKSILLSLLESNCFFYFFQSLVKLFLCLSLRSKKTLLCFQSLKKSLKLLIMLSFYLLDSLLLLF